MKKCIQTISVVCAFLCGLVLTAVTMLSRSTPEQFNVVAGDPLRLPGAIRVTDQKNATGQSVRASALSAGSTYQATLKLCGLFPLKDVKVKVVDQPLVIPCGVPFGIKMYTDGVLVVSMSDVDTATGPFNPARSAGIKTGDVIVSIDGETVTTTEQVASIVEESGGKTMTFHIRRDNIAFDIRFTPALSVNESRWKAGLWVRDSSAGIGTLTFFDPESQVFGGLGHAVCDVDTGEILPISSGEIVPARIYSVVKGAVGTPGELRGGFEAGSLGSLRTNGETGIYGELSTAPADGQAVPVAMKQQVHTGQAQVLTTIHGTTPKLYDIRIDQVRYNDSAPTRNMVIVITDEELLEQTGGIVQGMSGSPILQDGMLVGAVTHVFVNDPTKGFAIFAENMLKTMDSVAQSLEQQQGAA